MTRTVCAVVLVLALAFVAAEAWTWGQNLIARRRNDRMAGDVIEEGHDAG